MSKKRAIILCTPDNYANAIKPRHIQALLEKQGYEVTLFPTALIGHLADKGLAKWLPGRSLACLRLYLLEVWFVAAMQQPSLAVRRWILSVMLLAMVKARRAVLEEVIPAGRYNLLICENNLDVAVAATRLAPVQILDLPAPWAEEMFFGGALTPRAFVGLQSFEAAMYAQADYISFHWHTYAELVKRTKYNGPNFIGLSYGTDVKPQRARYSPKPRIVFLGYLAGYWVNLPLLEELSRLYPGGIDVYGGPPPPKHLRINYKGYAPTLDVLATYQFGLITISKDRLRRHSFSSKHLEYMSFGLPVLTPAWRKDELLRPGSILYTPKTFLKVLGEHSSRKAWTAKSEAARELAASLTWQRALQPLKDIAKGENS